VITPDTYAQAQERSLGALEANKGWQAAQALLWMMALYGKLKVRSA
jgi:6,7-dimethyl-8-ribityllumazine synthase